MFGIHVSKPSFDEVLANAYERQEEEYILRKDNPAVKEAFEKYQVILRMYRK